MHGFCLKACDYTEIILLINNYMFILHWEIILKIYAVKPVKTESYLK